MMLEMTTAMAEAHCVSLAFKKGRRTETFRQHKARLSVGHVCYKGSSATQCRCITPRAHTPKFT